MDLSLFSLAFTGAIAAALAAFAWRRDHLRRTRTDPDAVGFVDWTTVFFIALLAACLLLGGAARLWLVG